MERVQVKFLFLFFFFFSSLFHASFVSLRLPRDANGAFLLDCDARFFLPILNFLRRGELVVDSCDVAGVLAEAKYFGVEQLVQRLGGSTSGCEGVAWSDVGGLEGVKHELQQVFFLCFWMMDVRFLLLLFFAGGRRFRQICRAV